MATSSPEAYQSYLRGRYHWNRRSEADLNKARAYFERAVKLDPDFALAHAGLADLYVVLPDYTGIAPGEAASKAREAATTALRLDGTLGHAALAMAIMWEQDWETAEREFRRAIELNPADANVHHWYAFLLLFLGRHEESVQEIWTAQELDPVSLIINANVGFMLHHARRYDDAIEQLLKARELDPDFGVTEGYLGMAYLERGQYGDAISTLRRAEAFRGLTGFRVRAQLGHALGRSGDHDEALQILHELQAAENVNPVFIARVQVGLAMFDEALTSLEKAVEDRFEGANYLKVSPEWDPLRSEPRFQELLRRMKFTE